MRTILHRIILCTAPALLLSFVFTGDDFLLKLKDRLSHYNKTYGEERVYLQLDKTLYKPGEDIWFKAYVLQGSTMKPSPISTVLYVELIDPRGAVVNKSELFVEEGTTHGDFSFDKNVVGGLYTIRAFTRWMQNFSEENYFSKQITVQNLITPRLLLKIDFEKKAYGKSDLVSAHLKARNLKDEPLRNAEVKAQLKLNGAEFLSQKFMTTDLGEVDIVFQLPGDLNTTDGLILAMVSSDGVEESISRSVPIVLNKIHLQFFPEGGDIVAGADGKIAFKAVNEFGKGADVEGTIVDEKGTVISRFKSFHFGMGALNLDAKANQHYFARVSKPEGISEQYPLPNVKSSGFVLSLSNKSDSLLTARIYSSMKTEVFLAGHVHGQIHYAEKLLVNKGWNEMEISTKSMPLGIAVFTLFNVDGVEAAERLSFINRGKNLHIELSTDRKEYHPGEKVELTIKTFDHSGAPVRANLSLAVVDDQLLTTIDDKQDNLISWMLMSSELKGKIEEPSFYFDESEPKAKEALEYLLMVNGWRRFTWKEIFSEDRTITFLPENDTNLSGLVIDRKSRNTKAEVVLMELGNRKRIARVKSNEKGQFLFRKVDSSTPMLLLTKRPNAVEVNGTKSTAYTSQQNDYNYLSDMIVEVDSQPSAPEVTVRPDGDINANLGLDQDASLLNECVVTVAGDSEAKSLLGASVTTVRPDGLPILTLSSLEQQLAGRVAGVIITQPGQPGSNQNIQIRGTSTLGNRSEPLWVIDGVPFSGNINSNFTTGVQLTPGNINSVHIVKSPEATSLFGSRAANGAILIETKNRFDYASLNYVKKTSKYSVLSIMPRQYSVVREFYSEPENKKKEYRQNFNTTVLWKHTVVTDEKGNAKIQFNTNDAASTFRITAEGISVNGLMGRKELTYHALLPFSIDAKMPRYLGFEDTLKLPVRITNNTKSKLNGNLSLVLPKELKTVDSVNRKIEVRENQSITVILSLTSNGIAGSFPLAIKLKSDKRTDEIKNVVEVHPVGFPMHVSYSGKSMGKRLRFHVSDMERGSLTGRVVFVTDILQDLFTSAESMLREPHGCFEQVSSSTFPNILALQLLKETGKSNSAIENRALDLIESGYKMLKGYEISGGGFEWFGHPPAHEALTAFGLVEFKEMQQVYKDVNEQMIERTKQWLLSRRKGDGTFIQNHGKYGFSAAPKEVNDAYIVYALSETGVSGIEKEYNHSLTVANESNDMYLCALMANAALNFIKQRDYEALVTRFSEAVAKEGLTGLKIKSSVTYSDGNSLINETVSLWALALMKASQPNYELIKRCIEYIGSKRSYGMYGSTQATYLSLKAIAEYHKLVRHTRGNGEISVSLDQLNTTKSFTKDSNQNIVFNEFINQVKEGNNELAITFSNTAEPLPYSFDMTWNTKTPLSGAKCKLKLETQLKKKQVRVNETVRLSVKLINITTGGLPMSMAVIGIPAGLSLQPWQLKELKEKNAFDFYEIIGDKLAVYYRELGPGEVREINLDLKADLPGSFLSTASSAYLYYSDEFKFWEAGSKITIVN